MRVFRLLSSVMPRALVSFTVVDGLAQDMLDAVLMVMAGRRDIAGTSTVMRLGSSNPTPVIVG